MRAAIWRTSPDRLSFFTAASYAVGVRPVSAAAGDFRGDGMVGLAVVNAGSSTVSVLLGRGHGTFQPAVSYPAGFNVQGVAVGDFTGSGILDLAVANETGSGTVSVLLGNGDGTFKPPATYATGALPNSVAVGDFNGAGRPDVAVTNYVPGSNPGTVTALTNAGDWRRPPHRRPLSNPVPVQVLVVGPTTTAPVLPAPALFTPPVGQAPAPTPTSKAAVKEVVATSESILPALRLRDTMLASVDGPLSDPLTAGA
jgi:hypothetical protein